MMNHDKWINTLPGKNYNINNSKQELDPNIWLNTIPKTEKKNSLAKYSFLSILLIFGVISVILIKQEYCHLLLLQLKRQQFLFYQ